MIRARIANALGRVIGEITHPDSHGDVIRGESGDYWRGQNAGEQHAISRIEREIADLREPPKSGLVWLEGFERVPGDPAYPVYRNELWKTLGKNCTGCGGWGAPTGCRTCGNKCMGG